MKPYSDYPLTDDIRVTSGFQLAAGAIGGIYASLTFQQKQAPKYSGGLWATAAAQFAMNLGVVVLLLHNHVANRQADRKIIIIEGLEGFRYTQ